MSQSQSVILLLAGVLAGLSVALVATAPEFTGAEGGPDATPPRRDPVPAAAGPSREGAAAEEAAAGPAIGTPPPPPSAATPTADTIAADTIAADRPGRPVTDVATLTALPSDDGAVAAAFDAAAARACEFVPPGEPAELSRFVALLTEADRASAVEWPSTRRQAFSIGLEVAGQDRRELPQLSGTAILDYVRDHCVSIQMRIRRDYGSGTAHLHHRPLAATLRFDGARLTQPTSDVVAPAIREFRSLGLFLNADERPTPENLRTLVLVHRHERVPSGAGPGRPDAEPNHEFVFVRARQPDPGSDEPLALHAFVTTDGRTSLHALRTGPDPGGARECGITASVRFVEFSHGGLYPKRAVVRRTATQSRAAYSIEHLDRFVRESGSDGGVRENLTDVLDAIIDGEVPPEPPGPDPGDAAGPRDVSGAEPARSS